MIILDRVGFAYPQKTVFRNLSLQLPDSGVVTVSGVSGCGKTTFLRLLAGLETPQSGRILGIGERRIAMLFQEDRLLPWRSVKQNVLLAQEKRNPMDAQTLLTQVGLADATALYPEACSGGMKRRAAFARVMAAKADIWLLDEPFNGQDGENISRMTRLLAGRPAGTLVIAVTHRPEDMESLRPVPVHLDDVIPHRDDRTSS